jgi:hypothetical protein
MKTMNRYLLSILLVIAMLSAQANNSSAQSRTFGAQRLMLDDGSHSLSGVVYLTSGNGGSLGIDQNGIISPSFPNPCALMDLSSTTKGLLIPRMSALNEAALCGGAPPEGMMVYNTTTHSLDVFSGVSWSPALGGAGWLLTGNTIPSGGTTAGSNYIGTNNAQDF